MPANPNQPIPHDVLVDIKVIVDDPVPHADNCGPWYVRVALAEFGAYAARGLPYHLEKVSQSKNQGFIIVEVAARLTFGKPNGAPRAIEHLSRIHRVIFRQTGAPPRQARARGFDGSGISVH